GVMEEIETEIEEGAGDRLTLHKEVLLVEVPAARANHEGRGLLVQLVHTAVGIAEFDRQIDRVDEVALSIDVIAPGWRVRVLDVGHVDGRTRVEGVDDHLAIGGSCDL